MFFGQVLGNLVANSLRHTPADGQVELGAALLPEDHGVELWVSNTGEGIHADDLPYVFDRFYRTDRSRARASGGAGLGLAIARQLVEAHGGYMEASSTVGHGTTISATLPLVGP